MALGGASGLLWEPSIWKPSSQGRGVLQQQAGKEEATHRPTPWEQWLWARSPCCRLCLPSPLSPQPHSLPLAAFSLNPQAATPTRCNRIIGNNIAHCMLGALFLWPRVVCLLEYVCMENCP